MLAGEISVISGPRSADRFRENFYYYLNYGDSEVSMHATLLNPKPLEAEGTKQLLFFGASRFEAPEPGIRVRHEGAIYEILSVNMERNRGGALSCRWKFAAECRVVE